VGCCTNPLYWTQAHQKLDFFKKALKKTKFFAKKSENETFSFRSSWTHHCQVEIFKLFLIG